MNLDHFRSAHPLAVIQWHREFMADIKADGLVPDRASLTISSSDGLPLCGIIPSDWNGVSVGVSVGPAYRRSDFVEVSGMIGALG